MSTPITGFFVRKKQQKKLNQFVGGRGRWVALQNSTSKAPQLLQLLLLCCRGSSDQSRNKRQFTYVVGILIMFIDSYCYV